MILFTLLLFLIVAVAIGTLVIAGVLGGGILVIFGDIIVCGLIIYGLIKIFIKKD